MLSSTISEAFAQHPYLHIPAELQHLLDTEKDLPFINGCGPETGIFSGIWLTSIGGVCVSPACMIHDFRYYAGATLADKAIADMEFLSNLIKILSLDKTTINASVSERQIRIAEAIVLFKVVHEYGFKSFFARKNTSPPDASYLHDIGHSILILFRTILIPFNILHDAILLRLKMRKITV